MSSTNQLAAFENIGELMDFAEERGLTIQPEKPPIYDFDALKSWTKTLDIEKIECESFLNAWNMLGDIEKTFGRTLKEPEGSNAVYDKLFYGNNVPSITPEGKCYIPEWTTSEAFILASVFRAGLRTLRGIIKNAT